MKTQPLKPSALLSKPGAWCQKAEALDRHHNTVDGNSPHACQWCLLGALARCFPGDDDKYDIARAEVRNAIPPHDWISTWNDTPGRTQAEVVALLQSVGL
jgi:hypothetical protein